MNVLAILPDLIPSTRIGIVTPLTYLEQKGQIQLTCCLEQEVTPSQVLSADVIVTGRNTEPQYKPVYELAHQYHIPIIFELDDDLFQVPSVDSDAAYYNQQKRHEHLAWMLRTASLVRVYSPTLEQVVKQYNDNVEIVSAAVDWSLVPAQLPSISSEPVHIVYATSRVKSDVMFQQLLPDLQALLDRYRDKVVLHFLGYRPPEFLNFPNVVFVPFQSDYQSYFTHFTRFGYGIGLAPMLDGDFYLSKTNLKFREYAAAGAAGIYKDSPVYKNGNEGVIHRETGLLVDGTAGSWLSAIEELLHNPALLQTIRANARQYAEEHYNLHAVGETWLRHLNAHPSPQPIHVDTVPNWWFTRSTHGETQFTKSLRTYYRRYIPMKWRLRLKNIHLFIRFAIFKLGINRIQRHPGSSQVRNTHEKEPE